MYPPIIQKLIELFSKFPTVGPRTAARFVFYLIKSPKEKVDQLLEAVSELKEKIKSCSFCFDQFEPSTTSGQGGKGNLCKICSNPIRDKNLLCIVEKETDLASIENTKKYKGLYFVLGGTVSSLRKSDIEKLRIKELRERIKNPSDFGISTNQFQEIILAINPTTEGEATSLYLERELKPLACGEQGRTIKITRLGRGLPVGGELEYADEETLRSAFEGRK